MSSTLPSVLHAVRQWHPTPVLLPGKSHGWRSLVGCSPWGREESDTTERLHFHFSLSCFGEGNGNPLHCSCLENPRDAGAWWGPFCGVAQSRTQLKQLSSSSSNTFASSRSWWWTGKPGAAVHGVAKSRTWLSNWTELNWTHLILRATLRRYYHYPHLTGKETEVLTRKVK